MRHVVAAGGLVGLAVVLLLGAFWPTQASAEAQLDVLMRERLNPAFTSVSYELFHRPGPPGDRREDILRALEHLHTQTKALVAFPMPDGDTIPFRIHATTLHRDVGAMLEAAGSGDDAQVQHWFQHVQATCNGCHEQYRF
ncbi:MAG: cytochrome c [Myxococcota bacterium]